MQALHGDGILHREVSLWTIELDDASSFDTARCALRKQQLDTRFRKEVLSGRTVKGLYIDHRGEARAQRIS